MLMKKSEFWGFCLVTTLMRKGLTETTLMWEGPILLRQH